MYIHFFGYKMSLKVPMQDVEANREEGDEFCPKCEKMDYERSSVESNKRTVCCLTAVCVVLCVLACAACAGSVVLFWKIDHFRDELKAQLQHQQQQQYNSDEYGYYEAAQVYDDDNSDGGSQSNSASQERFSEHTRMSRGDRGKGKRKNCRCQKKYLLKLIRNEIRNQEQKRKAALKTTRSPATVRPEEQKDEKRPDKNHIRSSHYTSIVDEAFIKDRIGNIEHGNIHSAAIDVNIPEWKGTLFRNRSLLIQDAPTTLTFLQEADWTKDKSEDEQLFTKHANGTFVARVTGLYHVYAHVTILLEQLKDVNIVLLHESQSIMSAFQCHKSVSHVSSDFRQFHGYSVKHRFCSVSADIHVDKGDTFELVNLSQVSLTVDLTRNSTYFGANLAQEW